MPTLLRFIALAATMAVANLFAGVGSKAAKFFFKRLLRM